MMINRTPIPVGITGMALEAHPFRTLFPKPLAAANLPTGKGRIHAGGEDAPAPRQSTRTRDPDALQPVETNGSRTWIKAQPTRRATATLATRANAKRAYSGSLPRPIRVKGRDHTAQACPW